MKSEHFDLVKNYYDQELWPQDRVKNAIGKWITKEEYEIIVGINYDE